MLTGGSSCRQGGLFCVAVGGSETERVAEGDNERRLFGDVARGGELPPPPKKPVDLLEATRRRRRREEGNNVEKKEKKMSSVCLIARVHHMARINHAVWLSARRGCAFCAFCARRNNLERLLF